MTELFIALGGAGVLLFGAVAVLAWPRPKPAVQPAEFKLIEAAEPLKAYDPGAVIDLDAINRAATRKAVETLSQRAIDASADAQAKTFLTAMGPASAPP